MGLLNFHQQSAPPAQLAAAKRVLEISNALRAASHGLALPSVNLAGAPMRPGGRRAP